MFSGGASPFQSYTKVRRKDMLKAKSVRGKTGASPKRGLAQYFVNNWDLYAMLLLPLVYIVIFKYVPMAGVQMAFRDYSVFKGMWDSPWVGLEHFKTFFSSSEFGKLLTNTLTLRGCLTARLLPRLLLSLPPVKTLPQLSAGAWSSTTKTSTTARPLA